MKLLTIGEVARRAGVVVEQIRAVIATPGFEARFPAHREVEQ